MMTFFMKIRKIRCKICSQNIKVGSFQNCYIKNCEIQNIIDAQERGNEMVNEKILSFIDLKKDILNQDNYKYISNIVDDTPSYKEYNNYPNYDNGYSFE